jgi:DNA primase
MARDAPHALPGLPGVGGSAALITKTGASSQLRPNVGITGAVPAGTASQATGVDRNGEPDYSGIPEDVDFGAQVPDFSMQDYSNTSYPQQSSRNQGSSQPSYSGDAGNPGKKQWGRAGKQNLPPPPGTVPKRRSVAPMARRLLRLLLSHPELVDQMGDQQLEVLERGPHLEMVRDLIVLAQSSGARHLGALIQAADPGGDLGVLMASVAADLMTQEVLPEPQKEWEDALRRIELESLRQEQDALIAEGANNLQFQQKYGELSQRIARLIRAIDAGRTN